ncbi:hypothetical protein TMatcc_006713 [Talaromyces marneffei ATCC 18224]|uniref:Aspartyl protease, putative n=1 Tax=Talaromyces marneffei (strain ATCC 18224 / CBS 334.59 / QM 7333) TaxID=441960 RepID=B6Q9G4_TALMQ|nr:uncharacterized protein EYB26_002364 [Talaromyces marneffei]EEA25071.1 aspartyl protease, putative [Talaromyces marneffei ATCC 18224]KAE8553816.1 hypothetical protein EYB25_002354 [Talaromyces marneffei]QGA14708.1 hypothetical protein EYB26_002364 [Talaromyces marneffei]
MANSKTIISVLFLLALATASAFLINTNFSITQIAVKVPAVHPAAIYAQIYTKFGISVPDHIALAARSGWTDSVAANPSINDLIYLTPIQIGDNTLQVCLDTGSANLWAYTPQTPSVGSHATYNPQTGRLMPGYDWFSTTGDQTTLRGRVFQDLVKIGHLSYPNQAIQVVDIITPRSAMYNPNQPQDGIFGLAFSSMNCVRPTKQKTFFANIKRFLNAPLFAFCLKHRTPSTIDFGWIDSRKYKGQIVWTDVNKRYRFWNISIDGFSIGRDPSSSIPFSAIVDTGSSINLLPEYIVNQYYKRIPDSYKSTQHGGYIFPCTQTSIIPDFSLKIGQYIAVTPGQLLKFSSNGTHCFGGIQSSPFSSLNILGEVFLKNQYVIFFDDDRNARIGIAPQA